MAHQRERPDGTQAAAEAMLRDPALTIAEIARRLGVPRRRVDQWNRRSCLRPPPAGRRAVAAWSPARKATVLRLLRLDGLDPADLMEALGFAKASAPALAAALSTALGVPAPPGTGRAAPGDDDRDGWPEGETVDPRRLRALLRNHVGRQIGVFDAALADPPAGLDSAKVLRDLGGLKRLLDDLGPEGDPGYDRQGEGETGDASARPGDEPAIDLDEFRAEIARRYERFVGGGPAD